MCVLYARITSCLEFKLRILATDDKYKISLHVRNACSSLFEPLDMEEVHRYVQAWLVRNVKGCCPMVLRTTRRGVYVINMESRKVRQLELEFLDTDEPQTIGDECADNVSDEELQLTFL